MTLQVKEPITLKISEDSTRILLSAINNQIAKLLCLQDEFGYLTPEWITYQTMILALKDMENSLYASLGE